jgi:SAM-dependent methyltransferase
LPLVDEPKLHVAANDSLFLEGFNMHQKGYWEREELSNRRLPHHPVIASYAVPKINELSRYVSLTKHTRLLDVGCGNGFFTLYFDRLCDAYGVDYSETMLKMNPVKQTFLMDANALKFDDNFFDVVFCHALLHHVEDVDRVVREMRRVSKRHVVILEPNRNNPFMFLFSLMVREERKALKFSLGYLNRMVSNNDLKVLAAFSYGMTVPNKTPPFLLPLLKLLDFRQPLGMTNFVIATK